MSSHAVNELSSDSLTLLFSCLASRVLISLVCSLKLSPCDLTLTVFIKRLPGMLDNCQSLFIHVRSDSINEFFISDVAVSVLVEVVVNAGELLGGHEASKL